MGKEKIGTIVTVMSAIGFGSMAIFAKLAYAAGSNVMTLLTIRFVFASLLFIVALRITNNPLAINRKQLLSLFALGFVGYGVFATIYFWGISLIPASMSGFLLYTYPTMVCLFACLFKYETICSKRIVALIISALGLILILGPSFEQVDMRGVFAVLLAALLYSLYIVFSSRILKDVHWLAGSAVVTFSSAIFFLVAGTLTRSIFIPSTWGVIFPGVGLALFSTFLPIAGFYLGLSLIGPSKASIVSALEPIVTAVMAAILFSESLTLIQLSGGGFVLVSIILLQSAKGYKELRVEVKKANN